MFQALAADADNEYAMIDSTIVRAHQHSAGAKKKGGPGRGNRAQPWPAKHENPCHRRCTGQPDRVSSDTGQAHDLEGADALLPGTPATTVIADKAYDAQERLIDPLQTRARVS